MDGRTDFMRRWRRTQLTAAIFASCVFLAALFEPKLLIPIWVIGLPVVGFLMWQLRCWQCRERLLANGGSEIAWRKDGFWNWKPCLHKRCGAPLL